jgi:hypothetical protein
MPRRPAGVLLLLLLLLLSHHLSQAGKGDASQPVNL